ncbi:MAG: hypothetical protein QXG39_01905 [Candidatus Aenigmatarchaeota archaeon]
MSFYVVLKMKDKLHDLIENGYFEKIATKYNLRYEKTPNKLIIGDCEVFRIGDIYKVSWYSEKEFDSYYNEAYALWVADMLSTKGFMLTNLKKEGDAILLEVTK